MGLKTTRGSRYNLIKWNIFSSLLKVNNHINKVMHVAQVYVQFYDIWPAHLKRRIQLFLSSVTCARFTLMKGLTFA